MNRFDLRELSVQLYYSATGKHDIDDHQWSILLDSFNKKLWRDAARDVGSLLQLDTPDLSANIAGGFDYSGSIYGSKNDISQPIKFNTTTVWTNSFATLTPNAVTGPTGNEDATLMVASSGGGATLTATGASTPYPSGSIDIYFKAAQISSNPSFLYLGVGGGLNGGSVWFDTLTATVKTNGITGSVATVVPASYPGFPYQVGVTSSATPTTSPTGWYHACVLLPPNVTSSSMIIGLSSADGSTTTVAGTTSAYIWGARKTFMGSPAFGTSSGNMIDANGVHMITAAELKYLGRYIKLDYQIPQDRFIYNIAFGQIQALIPNAYTIMGEQILLLPKTTGSQVMRISYIPRMVDWVDDNAQALNGFLPEWHHTIAYEAASLMAGKQGEALTRLRDEMRAQWKDFASSRQRQDGRQIRFVPYE